MGNPAFLAVGKEFLICGDGRGVIREPGHAIHDGCVQQVLRPLSWPTIAHGKESEAASCDACDLPRRRLARLAAPVGDGVLDSDRTHLAVRRELFPHGEA